EVMTGFGRTGKMFCVEHWGVSPDIMSMAKGISGAYLPVGATMTSRKIAEYFDQPENNFSHGQTYANHPMCCAVSLATIEEYEKKKIVQNAARMGKVMEKRLRELAEEHRSIGEVRGKGLFWGVELVRNRETKEPFVARHVKADPNIIQRVSAEAMKRGVYISNFINTLIIAPPLIAKEKEIEEGVRALGEALESADKETR
ncbi:MAG TPA: aminotransferase class III-fold pyridoxal phosphate-dependent enzyme, partial [Candidatus Bathyarchaeia archaeon]